MRRKGITYYINTLALKFANRRFLKLKDKPDFIGSQEKNKQELLHKYNLSSLNFPEFNLQYSTYFYFKNTDIFDQAYAFNNNFPVGLKGKEIVPLVPLYYGLVYINTSFHLPDFDIDRLKKIAHFTIENSLENNDGQFLIKHNFDYKVFGLKAPWISGITQAIASSFFLRLFTLTKEKFYLEIAEKLFRPCLISVKEGGCLSVTNSGLEWVEEYNSNPSALVLSGHIFAIISAAELFQLSKKEEYKFYTENWLRSLVSELSTYQFEKYIIHNKYQWKLSNIEYQGLYVGQFKHLYELTGNDVFLELYNYYNRAINWNNFYSFYGMKK